MMGDGQFKGNRYNNRGRGGYGGRGGGRGRGGYNKNMNQPGQHQQSQQ